MMLTLSAISPDNLEIKRVFRALGQGSTSSKESFPSSPRTPIRERFHPLSKSVIAKDLPKVYSLPWKPQPGGRYVPNQEYCTAYPYVADLAAELPVSSKELYILADGDHFGNGVINVYEDNENKLVGSDIFVDVKMYYDNPIAVKMTDISYVHSMKNENGVRITTSPAISLEPVHRYISINVRIPRSTGSEPLSLPAFRTHLPNFTHTIGELGGIAQFQSITLSSADKAIIVKSLSAQRIRLRTTNGSIEGSFSSNQHISLRTVNAPISADIVLTNNGEGWTGLEMLSSNAEISASMALESTAPKGKIPSFRVLAKSSNKTVNLKAVSSPLKANTQMEIQTSNAPATFRLPASYEGKFDLHSTPFKPVVNVNEDVKDPAGLERKREVHNDRSRRGLLSGSISWVEDEHSEGAVGHEAPSKGTMSKVSIKTSNAEAHVFL
ncbi:hypothetical protein BDY19DRAFT_995394 [Irpex rosettiformis]|uniref:Uncharacterized protein n=1 Tax=Irpex rosettiformis TaxID=378272 RepID=A0ACB8TY38_9APHY|nr:hypothetical protein BDY19DRAFT_995394 [Irpex rosettiformis]